MSGLQPASPISPPGDRETLADQVQWLSRTQLAVILEDMADGIALLDPAGQLIYSNDAAARLLGYPNTPALLAAPQEDLLRQVELFDEAGRPLAAEDLPGRQALRGLPSPPQAVRFRIRATGEERWLLATSQAVFNTAGALELVVSIFREITDFKRGELSQRLNADLEQQETSRAAQIEAAYARLRDEIAERRQAEDQIRQLYAQLEQRVAERTAQLEEVNRELQREVGERQQTSQTLHAVLRRTRELYRISQTIGSAGTPAEILAALLSSSYLTTVSRASIAIFTAPFAAEPPPLCDILAAWNRETDLPDFVGERLTLEETGLLPPYAHDQPIVIESVRTKKEFPWNVRRRFEQLKTRSLIIFPLIARGAWYGVLSLHFKQRRAIKVDDLRHIRGLVDQTAIAIDNIRLLAAEAKARHEAEEANELKLKFLAMISHELRTPLTSIKGFATTLLAEDVQWHPATQHDFLRTIDEEADKLGDLIEQLLDLSRLAAGTLRIAPKPQTLEHVIATALAQLQTMTIHHQLVLNVPDDVPLIHADAERIGQVLTNLVGNAARYSPAQTTITVAAQHMNGMVQIDVIDQGPGIPLPARARIFEPFDQAGRPPTARTGGAGLGLAICRGLVEAHGGRIWVQDRAEPGTTISFTVPMAREHTT